MDHTIVHFEIPAEEPERAIAFYQAMFGWSFHKGHLAGPVRHPHKLVLHTGTHREL